MKLSVAEGENVSVEKELADVKKALKDNDRHFLQLNEVLESCKKQLANSETKVTKLNIALGNSQHELTRVLPQLVAAPKV